MKRNYKLFIEDIIESINAIGDFSKDLTREGLKENRLKQSAIVREIEIIGEAAKNLPKDLTDKYKDIPWKEIAGMRDIIIHGYFKVDLDAVWLVIEKDLPDLKKKILKVKKDLDEK